MKSGKTGVQRTTEPCVWRNLVSIIAHAHTDERQSTNFRGSGNSSDRVSLQKALESSYSRNCYGYACRSVRLTREVARKRAARITRRALESGMRLTGRCT